jgi:hypothetical protein
VLAICLVRIMIKTCRFLDLKAASLGPLETVRVSVNFFSWCVLRRPPGISANCWNAVDTDLSRKPRLKYWSSTNQAQGRLLSGISPLSIGRNAFQSGQCSNGGHVQTQLLMNLSLFFINNNFINQLSGWKWYWDVSLFLNQHRNNWPSRQSG